MILIYGSTGYMGSAIAEECRKRGISWREGDRGNANQVQEQFEYVEPKLVINAAAFIPSPTVDACKHQQEQTIIGNVLWPTLLHQVCEDWGAAFMHLSTGCLFDEQREYAEDDEPTRGWNGYCGFYVGTKLLAEKLVRAHEKHYILRLRLPFDEVDHPRNYLSKLMKFDRVFEHVNSLTHRGDFAKWALDLWEKRAPFGAYRMVNTGQISATAMVMNMGLQGLIPKLPQFVKSPDTTGAWLSNAKLASAIGPVRNVHEAVAEAINNWKPR